ncbi:MAG: CcmD family protein [Acidobacteriota bacterium]
MKNDFTAVCIAYAVVYAAIALYAILLGSRERRLRGEIESLRGRGPRG